MITPGRADQPCEIIVDMTGFTSSSQLPVQWLKYVTEVVPVDIRNRIKAVHFLNVNSVAYRYLRRLHNLSAGSHFGVDAKMFASVAELSEHVHPNALVPLQYASML
jgi:Divergent CRAL/TRIO domain